MKTTEMIANLDPKIAKFIETVSAAGGPPIYKLPIDEARAVLSTIQSQPIKKLPVEIKEIIIPGGALGEISINMIRPENSKGDLPCALFFCGGGWILGNKNTHDRLVREIVNGAHCAVAFVNYSPSPEVKYPVALEQCYLATKYIAEHGKELKLDTRRLAVIGDSVGGNMATVVTLLAKERNGPKIAYQVLFYPVTDAGLNTPSYQQFAEGPWLTKKAMEWFWNAYSPNVAERKKYTLSPLQASLEQLRNLPPTLLITCESDVLRDEGEAYAHKLMQAGVNVCAIRYLGACHDFVMLNPLADTTVCRSAISLACSKLQEVFKQ